MARAGWYILPIMPKTKAQDSRVMAISS